MHRYTYICNECGALRRRSSVAGRIYASDASRRPLCCGRDMIVVLKAEAEAASKLTKAERLLWMRAGALVLRRPGRRWIAALTAGQRAQATEQLVSFRRSQQTSRASGRRAT
jgi:hypothetical protein